METKIFQEDQDKLVTPFFPVSSLYVLVTSSSFLRCGLPTNHEDHYKQASNAAKLQLFFALLLGQERRALLLFCLTGKLQHSSKVVFAEWNLYSFLCVIRLACTLLCTVCVKARSHRAADCCGKAQRWLRCCRRSASTELGVFHNNFLFVLLLGILKTVLEPW